MTRKKAAATTAFQAKAPSPDEQARADAINANGRELFGRMLAAQQEGGSVEDALGAKGTAALRQLLTGSAEETTDGMVIPSVEYKGRGFDPFSMLLKERTIFLSGQVDDNMAAITVASLLFLNTVDKKKEIQVYIDSPGGVVTSGLAMYDTMRFVEAPIKTVGLGLEASMGSLLMLGGDTRYMMDNATYMVHQPLGGARGQATDIMLTSDNIDRTKETLKNIYVGRTGLNHDFWDIVLDRDTYLSSKETMEIGGIIDGIIQPTNPKKTSIYEEFAERASFTEKRKSKIPGGLEEIKDMLRGDGDGTQLRPELIVALSKFPKYWTPPRFGDMAVRELAKENATLATEQKKLLPALALKFYHEKTDYSVDTLLGHARQGSQHVADLLGVALVKANDNQPGAQAPGGDADKKAVNAPTPKAWDPTKS